MQIEMRPFEHMDRIPAGKIVTFEMEMVPYPDHRTRRILVWTPEDYDGEKRFPVIYLHDGQGVFRDEKEEDKLEADRVLTELSKEGISAIVVAIDTGEDRGNELTPPYRRNEPGAIVNGYRTPRIDGVSSTPTYARFVIETLMPVINEHFMTLTGPEATFVGGVSAGGSCSYYMMMQYPEVFGGAMICSPGFPMFVPEALPEEIESYDMSRLAGHRFAFYNGNQGIDVTSVDYVLSVYRKLREKGMEEKGLMFLLDTRQGHCNAAWRKYLPEILRFLLG